MASEHGFQSDRISVVNKYSIDQAASRINDFDRVYSTEVRRVETVLASIMLPAALSILSINWSGGIFAITSRTLLMVFFVTYLLLIFIDMAIVEKYARTAKKAQIAIYKYNGKVDDTVAASNISSLAEDIALLESKLDRSIYIAATGKPIIALLVALLTFFFMSLPKQ